MSAAAAGHIRFGCQTYTWLMSGATYRDRLDHIMAVGARAAFSGLESEVVMLGRLADPTAMAGALRAAGLSLGAICLVEDWRGPGESPAEREDADRFIGFVRRFPGTKLVLCQMPGTDRVNLRERQRNLLRCVGDVAGRARDQGVSCTYHANSPEGSVFRTAADYEILIEGLDPAAVGFTPDLGHIARGGMDPLEMVRRHRARIDHLHFKDMYADGRWAPMGEGVIDFPAVVAFLRETRFDGWIMVEDECARAEQDPDGATATNGIYVRERLMPAAPPPSPIGR